MRVAVLGHGKSGTSCCIRVLGEAGLDIGPAGIRRGVTDEWDEIVLINQGWLKEAGHTKYADPPPLDRIREVSPPFIKRIRQLMLDRPNVSFKDPTMVYTWKVWDEEGLLPKKRVFVFRNPIDCANSHVGVGFTYEEGLRSWAIAHKRTSELWKNPKTILWNFDDLCTSAIHCTSRLNLDTVKHPYNLRLDFHKNKSGGLTDDHEIDGLYSDICSEYLEQIECRSSAR